MAQIKTNLQYGVTGSLQTANIGASQITNSLMADDAIGLAEMASGTDGNIITYDASGNPAVVAVGTSGHFLKSQGAGSVPVFAAAGGGKIGQVVNATSNTETSSTSTTYADTSLTVDITPTATSSKILVVVCMAGIRKHSHATALMAVKLVRDSTDLFEFGKEMGYTATTSYNHIGGTSATYLDSPSSTSALTYKVQFENPYATGTVTIQNASSVSTITVMEVLA